MEYQFKLPGTVIQDYDSSKLLTTLQMFPYTCSCSSRLTPRFHKPDNIQPFCRHQENCPLYHIIIIPVVQILILIA